MSKLQSYVLKEVFKAFLPAFLALLLIMVLGFCVQLLHEGLDVVRLHSLPRYIASFSVPWVLPSAFLTAVIMAFGRLAADNELIAMKTGGVHLMHVMIPVYGVALVLSVVAAYFHFETVPKARQGIEIYKYEAVKSILMDRVSVSAQRQLTFYPCTIFYENFKNQEMEDLLILEAVGDGFPRTIITAESGRIRPDPERPAYVNLVLKECVSTRLSEEGSRRRGTITADSIELPVEIGGDVSDVAEKIEHLPLSGLLAEMHRLKKEVASHPARFPNPEEVRDEAEDELDDLDVPQNKLRRAVRKFRGRIQHLNQNRRSALTALIQQKKTQIEAAAGDREMLQKQLVTYHNKIQELEESETGYEEITALQKKLQQVKQKVTLLGENTRKAEAEIETAREQMRQDVSRARELGKEVQALERELDAIGEQEQRWEDVKQRAGVQEDLRELRVRAHRRLALSMAVLVFAMIGMPLGIMTRHRSTMVAFGVGFAIVLLLFYPFLIAGQIAAESGVLPVAPALWSGNAVTFIIGVVLTMCVLRR